MTSFQRPIFVIRWTRLAACLGIVLCITWILRSGTDLLRTWSKVRTLHDGLGDGRCGAAHDSICASNLLCAGPLLIFRNLCTYHSCYNTNIREREFTFLVSTCMSFVSFFRGFFFCFCLG